MNRVLKFTLTATLLSTPVMAAPLSAEPGPRTRTEPALACLLGFASWGCRHTFFEPLQRLPPIRDCAHEYVHERQDGCPSGYLVAVNYLGTNADGNDVYHVRFRHGDTAYVLKPPGPDGKVNGVWITGGGTTPSRVVDVPPDRLQQLAMYRRPWH